MKKAIFLVLVFAIMSIICNAQTAANFTATDCDGTSHDLYTELNAGKIVVITWVMPCTNCIAASRAAHDAVQSFATTNPNRVVSYLADDLANTSCQTLTTWRNTNLMPNSTVFSTTALSPSNYGTTGMPKVIVIGGGIAHKIYYNEIDGANTSGIQPAIALALQETGINELSATQLKFSLNSIENNKAKVSFTLNNNKNADIELYSELGQRIKTIDLSGFASGENNMEIDISGLSNGLFFMKLNQGNITSTLKFSIIK